MGLTSFMVILIVVALCLCWFYKPTLQLIIKLICVSLLVMGIVIGIGIFPMMNANIIQLETTGAFSIEQIAQLNYQVIYLIVGLLVAMLFISVLAILLLKRFTKKQKIIGIFLIDTICIVAVILSLQQLAFLDLISNFPRNNMMDYGVGLVSVFTVVALRLTNTVKFTGELPTVFSYGKRG